MDYYYFKDGSDMKRFLKNYMKDNRNKNENENWKESVK